MKFRYFECACCSPEHTLCFCYDEEDNELYLTVYLNQYRNIFKRILVAIKYVLGYRCKYGVWDTFILRKEDKEKFISVVNQLKD